VKAWQRQIRERREGDDLDADLFGQWWCQSINLRECEVELITAKDASSIILNYEWLGTMAPYPWRCFGLKHDGVLIGASVFVTRKNGNVPYTLFGHRSCALVRGAVVHWAPNNAASFMTNRAVKLIGAAHEEIKLAVSFVDSEAGEIGTIYQAAGWRFLGWKQAKRWQAPNGRTYNLSHHRNLAWNRRPRGSGTSVELADVKKMKAELLRAGWKIVTTGERGRYATVLRPSSKSGREFSRLIDKHAKPYPKRAVQESRADSPGIHREGAVQSCGTAPLL
jgi:hypothetical protein